MRRDAAREPAHRRRPDPARPPPPADRAPAARAAVRHLGLDGALRPRLSAVPHLRAGGPAGAPHAVRGVRVRHAADAADPGAALAQPRARDRSRPPPPRPTGPAAPGSAMRCKSFNDRHGRRGMARGAVVVILSDGWERGDPALVGREMERLSRLAYRIVWVNPRAAAAGFAPRAGGMAAALPYCDALVSGHSLAALDEVVEAIGGEARRRRGAPAAAASASRRAAVASATPVPAARWRCRAASGRAADARCPGSSVAMPPGYGPLPRPHDAAGWSLGAHERRPPKICIYPGCDAPRRAAAPARRPAAELLRPRGAQRADRASGAPAARARCQAAAARDEQRRVEMANEAYRAVFLRVHPDRQDGAQPDDRARRPRGRLRPPGRRRARRPGARRQGRSGRHRPVRRRTRLQHQPVARARRRRSRRRPTRSSTKARLLAGSALDAPPEARALGRRRVRAPASEADGAAARRSPTSRCTPTAPARCRPGSRAAWTPRPSTATDGRAPGRYSRSARQPASIDRRDRQERAEARAAYNLRCLSAVA